LFFRKVSSTEAPHLTTKRSDYLEWPEYFMAIAFLSAQRSKDPFSQVGLTITKLSAIWRGTICQK